MQNIIYGNDITLSDGTVIKKELCDEVIRLYKASRGREMYDCYIDDILVNEATKVGYVEIAKDFRSPDFWECIEIFERAYDNVSGEDEMEAVKAVVL